jgi:V8-like Glu-specific endopeptidase
MTPSNQPDVEGGRPPARQPSPGQPQQTSIEPGAAPASPGRLEAPARRDLHQRVKGGASPAEAHFTSRVATRPLFPRPEAALGRRGAAGPLPPFDTSRAVPAGLLSYRAALRGRMALLEARLSPETVLEGDRKLIPDTQAYPYRCICHLRMWFPAPGDTWVYAWGTGWAIGKRTVITAGHCVFVSDDPKFGLHQVWAAQAQVTPGKNGGDEPFGSLTVPTGNLRSTDGWVTFGQVEADYAAILLNEDLPLDGLAFGFGVLSDRELTGLPANVVGYPGEFRKTPQADTMWGDDTPPLDAPSTNRLNYRIDTSEGQSGSPVFFVRDAENDAIAVGIHNYGVEDDNRNHATRITQDVKKNLTVWREEGGGL